jgi:hypothetical protein
MVVEGSELAELLRVLFETKKSFITEVKLVEKDVWLNLSAGPMNDNLATIVATGILILFLLLFVVVAIYQVVTFEINLTSQIYYTNKGNGRGIESCTHM